MEAGCPSAEKQKLSWSGISLSGNFNDMNQLPWFERNLAFGLPIEMLPYYIERLSGTLPRLELKVSGVSGEILSNRLGGKWSVKQNIGHLAEVDEIANRRIDEMIAGVDVMSPAVFEPKDYNPWPIEKVLDYFRKTRSSNLLKYKSLTMDDLHKSSLHPRLKVPMTPVDLSWFDAEHDDHHLVKINEIIFTLTKTKSYDHHNRFLRKKNKPLQNC
jgi:hypothetical protein